MAADAEADESDDIRQMAHSREGNNVEINPELKTRGKVLTLLTLLIINNLTPYTTPYIFWKILTSLEGNDLSPYTNVKAAVRSGYCPGYPIRKEIF
jgi:hypothetical protein